jgi:glycosyltransferase involved in cell wall biosynthesis
MTSPPNILIATPVKNAENELAAYFASILGLNYPKQALSLFLLESDSEDNTDLVIREFLKSQENQLPPLRLQKIHYKRVSVGFQMSSTTRHAEAVQYRRRQVLAEARNEILDSANLEMFDFILWLDVDATGFPASLIEDLLGLKKPMVAPHVVWDFGGLTYDRNSWLETHTWVFETSEVGEEPKPMFEGYGDSEGARIYMDDFRQIVRGKFAEVPLHGVGTAVLLVDAKIHRDKNLRFPVTPYKRRVESEGFGLVAFDAGFQAIGLPNYEVKHVNHADFTGSSIFFPFEFCLLSSAFIVVASLLFLLYQSLRSKRRLLRKSLL